MEAGKRTISQICDYNRVLEIPFFQRSYVWDEENWDRFLDDMIFVSQENKDYFMGSIILKQKETPSDGSIGDWRVIVDGQQRLTTLTLFFKELCRVQDRYDDFLRIFINRKKEVLLKHNHNDVEIFEAIVNDKLSKELSQDHKESSILACHEYFRNKDDVLKDIRFDTLLNKIYFVGIDLGREEDEQQIFDTINSLGVSLTTAELLKNELFRREDEGLYNKTWKTAFESDNRAYWSQDITAGRQKRENIDLLLQSYLLLQGEGKDKYTHLESLFKNYKVLIKDKGVDHGTKSHEHFINGLMESADLYKRHIIPHLTSEAIDSKSHIERLNLIIFGLNTTTIIPYLVYIFQEVDDLSERENMFRLLENYLIRRFICKETTKNYNNLFVSFVRSKINSYQALHDKIYNAENQTDILPDDVAFGNGFSESNLTNQQAKTILYLLEISMRDQQKESTAVLGLDHYSLEHIMPKKWRNNWDNGLDEEAARKRDQLLLKLGNLTIITSSLNSSIRDQSWKSKKRGNNGKKGLDEYSKGIKIFDTPDFLQSSIWDEEKVSERSSFLSQNALDIWPYDKPM
ncbi:MAG: DUF262 domain-containing HNH endonuclease family protein [Nitrospinota bacterium]|nr:DUF262 domain-containing HNH endonuclease family protein [Nitrospinota bacterium]